MKDEFSCDFCKKHVLPGPNFFEIKITSTAERKSRKFCSLDCANKWKEKMAGVKEEEKPLEKEVEKAMEEVKEGKPEAIEEARKKEIMEKTIKPVAYQKEPQDYGVEKGKMTAKAAKAKSAYEEKTLFYKKEKKTEAEKKDSLLPGKKGEAPDFTYSFYRYDEKKNRLIKINPDRSIILQLKDKGVLIDYVGD